MGISVISSGGSAVWAGLAGNGPGQLVTASQEGSLRPLAVNAMGAESVTNGWLAGFDCFLTRNDLAGSP